MNSTWILQGAHAIDDSDALIDDLGDADAEITLIERSYRYVGRTKRVGEKSQRLRHSAIKDSLSPEAGAADEAVLAEQSNDGPLAQLSSDTKVT
ncbi:hypothetical protein RAZWK3B_03230 [Roseobacter sp. AzwK-3b]|uniref:hypothetical protein n=1 Tax=Roseobacter sp. AzwK-3b TaxID=351016 RepID=UPI0001568E2E|nr:hypothetical protein [Roseobacter sp. AzwK-3b]EDM73200.1 hypothetical protein RAZWK3B_03230 [Roseobacter sp. AzwK-3b]